MCPIGFERWSFGRWGSGIPATLAAKPHHSRRRHVRDYGGKMVFICRKVPNSDMILTCIDSYLVNRKAYFGGGVIFTNPLVGRKKISMARIRQSRLAALALRDLFAAGYR